MRLIMVSRARVVGYAVVVVIGLTIWGVWSYATTGRAYSPAPLKDLGAAPRTQIVAALDVPIEPGKNAVWCASFISAWKQLQNGLAGGPLDLDGAKELVASLNAAADPAADVPPGSLYAAAGWAGNGIAQKIQADVAQRFPDSPAPNLPPLGPMDLLAYARLEVKAKFPVPYFDAPYAVSWTDGAGAKHAIRTFGIHESHGYDELRRQASVLYAPPAEAQLEDFVLDLNDASQPVQILVAQVEKKSTLAETLAAVDAVCKTSGERDVIDVMLVPEMAWRVQHQFGELVGLTVQSGPLQDSTVKSATQSVDFRLDRSGAELRSEAEMPMAVSAISPLRSYIINRPYLLVMRLRSSQRPFFAAWIDNDELLRPFKDAK
jgi:hypothetical protein